MGVESNPRNLLHTHNGYYYGTEKGGVWYRRYWREGWLMRGNSVIWVTQEGLFFYRISKIMHIPAKSIRALSTGTSHAGKWSGGIVLKITWIKEGQELVSGFMVAKGKEETEKWISVMRELK